MKRFKFSSVMAMLLMGLACGLSSCEDDGLGLDEVKDYRYTYRYYYKNSSYFSGSYMNAYISCYAGKCGLMFELYEENRERYAICRGPVKEIVNSKNKFDAPLTVPKKVVYEGRGYTVIAIARHDTDAGIYGDGLDYSCYLTYLRQITLPETIGYIDEYAFSGYISLEKVIVKAEEPPTVAGCAFSCPNATLIVPTASVDAYKASNWAKYFSTIKGGAERM